MSVFSLYGPNVLSDYHHDNETTHGNAHNLYENSVKYMCMRGERFKNVTLYAMNENEQPVEERRIHIPHPGSHSFSHHIRHLPESGLFLT